MPHWDTPMPHLANMFQYTSRIMKSTTGLDGEAGGENIKWKE
jgi:hypothetical protein